MCHHLLLLYSLGANSALVERRGIKLCFLKGRSENLGAFKKHLLLIRTDGRFSFICVEFEMPMRDFACEL